MAGRPKLAACRLSNFQYFLKIVRLVNVSNEDHPAVRTLSLLPFRLVCRLLRAEVGMCTNAMLSRDRVVLFRWIDMPDFLHTNRYSAQLPSLYTCIMRIVSWNCNGALRNKTDPVDLLLADLLIVQECEYPGKSLSTYQQGQATISGKASIKIKVLEYLPAPVLNRLLSLAVFRFTLGPSPIIG